MSASRPGWIRRLLPYLLAHWPHLALSFGAAVVGMTVAALTPLIEKVLLDDVVLDDRRPLVPWLALLLGAAAFRFGAAFVRRFAGGRVVLDVQHDLRTAIHDHLQRLDFVRHDEMQTGQLVSRAGSDVALLQGLLSFLPLLTGNLVMLVVSVVVMAVLSPLLTVAVLLVIPAVLVAATRLRSTVFPAGWDAQQRAADVAGVVEEAVTGVRIVKAFGQERRELDRLTDAARGLFASRLRMVRLQARLGPLLQAVPALGQVAVLGLGGWLVVNDRITVGTFLAFSSYLVQLVMPVRMLGALLVFGQQARAGAERIFELLDSTPVVQERPDAVELPPLRGEVELDGVTFGYLRSQPVLRDFTLHVRPGERVALVGPSGSGKSTVASLLSRFYDVQEGAVRVDGIDVRDVRLESLRRQIGVVFEESFLFSDTIRANIAYGRPESTDAEIDAAARAAEAHEFVTALPDGYDTVVGERGLTLSGGQRQRIAIARALLTDPRILVLDDATSAVDSRVEEEIHDTLRRLMEGRTTILIANRDSTLRLADRVVTLPVLGEESRAPARESSPRTAVGPVAPMRFGGGAGMMGMGMEAPAFAPTPELEAALAALPPAHDEPDVDVAAETADDRSFTLRRFLRPYRRPLLVALVLMALDAVAVLSWPVFVRLGLDGGVRDGSRAALVAATLGFLAAVLADWVLQWAITRWTGRTAERLLFALRLRIFAHLQRLSVDFYEREAAGRVMTRMTTDVESLSALFQTGMVSAVVQALGFVGVVVVMITVSPSLATAALSVLPVLVLATVWFRRRASHAYVRARDRIAAVNANLQESISGVRVAQAYAREARNSADFRDVAEQYFEARLAAQRLVALYFPFVEMLSKVATAVVLAAGAALVDDGAVSAGVVVAFLLYIDQLFAPVQQLSQVFDQYQQAQASTQKIDELLRTPTATPLPARPLDAGRIGGDIRFEGVRFRYPGARVDALAGVDLHVRPGETVALVGRTGAGKSTIVKLVARFQDPTEGRVLVDGIPLTDIDLGAYRGQLGFVPQEPHLFSGSIRDNIAYGRPAATDAEVEEAARAVGAHEVVRSLPGGYDATVAERGKSLSAGQRQLVALARALLVDPRILLLDEATANLDLATEARVQAAMRRVAEGRTTLLVAHRLPTAATADRILVVGDGRIVEEGDHDELVARGGAYADLWRAFAA
ncbi:MAG TPA: ABC transporter ATP-binding protein [Acidimicrobiales bacterium]|nr:ABC transporter ATP-binding protein [Acidimicrobiales bacterium]